MIEELREFLSTKTKRKVLYSYMFKKRAQSEIAKLLENEISVSSVDRITNILKYLGVLKKEDVIDNKQYYSINWGKWVKHAFKEFGIENIPEKVVNDLIDVISDINVISFYFYINSPMFLEFFFEADNLIKDFFKEFNEEGNLPYELMMKYLIKKGSNPAEYPIYFVFNSSPFNKLLSNITKDAPAVKDGEFDKVKVIMNQIYEENKNLGLIKINEISVEKITKVKIEFEKYWKKVYSEQLKKEVEEDGDEED